MARSRAIVVTGGIASGKSTVTSAFVALGVPTFDADAISRELVAKGRPALAEIAAAFGADALAADGELDRPRMRERIFGDEAARKTLESILHPRVRHALRERADACAAPYCLLAIPLFAESAALYEGIDRVLVVDVPPEVQLARLMRRDGMTEDSARRALAAQATRAQRLALADDVIDNTGALDALPRIVARLHERYLALARAKKAEMPATP